MCTVNEWIICSLGIQLHRISANAFLLMKRRKREAKLIGIDKSFYGTFYCQRVGDVNFSTSCNSMVLVAAVIIWWFVTFGLIAHIKNPAMVILIANTANGNSVVNNDNEPINEAVNRQMRPQIVHDINRDALRCDGTNSVVLDTITTNVMLTTHFSDRFNIMMPFGWSCAVPATNKFNAKLWKMINLYAKRWCLARIGLEEVGKNGRTCSCLKKHENNGKTDADVQQSRPKPFTWVADYECVCK